ncbi:MAG: hypothetical protein IT215_07820 [Chitinophagaceae bacterium]|nr:hypothetical protein [Chitinophagaceae bacterium]
MLDKNNFEPDSTFNTQFPWADVINCFDKELLNDFFKGHNKCPKCGRNSEELLWILFRSPDWTWQQLCGYQGPLSICPKCNIQVEFIVQLMN